jgi:hypothetical protein
MGWEFYGRSGLTLRLGYEFTGYDVLGQQLTNASRRLVDGLLVEFRCFE